MGLLDVEKFIYVGNVESRGKCRVTSLWANMAEEGRKEEAG
jgi:hypothetical protein